MRCLLMLQSVISMLFLSLKDEKKKGKTQDGSDLYYHHKLPSMYPLHDREKCHISPALAQTEGTSPAQNREMDVYLTEKPRAKEWFADNIPGLYKLSKGEVLDDIDFINNNLNFTSNERASRFKRKAKLDDLETKRSNAPRACHVACYLLTVV
jgi:hypothetical protein